ncbi:MAG: hypothetical protein EBV06_17990, partial [Planctomycetia bacterium]|nr:hypothetical protein [Planctomycetia bacterium]
MSRENKAGLVVASSFLALIGVILAVKMREPTANDAVSTVPTLSMATAKSSASEPRPAVPDIVPVSGMAPIEEAKKTSTLEVTPGTPDLKPIPAIPVPPGSRGTP